MRLMILMLVVLLSLEVSTPVTDPELDRDCGQQVCLYSDNAKKPGTWKSGATLSQKARRKEVRKNSKRKEVELQVIVREGWGTVFIDGRYLPSAGLPIKPGKHELEVRDGETVIALGVLTIPRKLASMVVEVHADRT